MIERISDLRVVLTDFVTYSLTVRRKTEKVVVQLNAKAKNELYRSHVGNFERGLAKTNDKARQGRLDLRLGLEWREDYHWKAMTFRERLARFLQIYSDG